VLLETCTCTVGIDSFIENVLIIEHGVHNKRNILLYSNLNCFNCTFYEINISFYCCVYLFNYNYFAILCFDLQINYVSPSNEGRHIVLVWFFFPLPLLLLLLSEACPDHNIFVFPDRSIIFGMWVHDHKAVCRIP